MTTFTDRIARSAGHRVDAACAARPPGTTLTAALCAGAGAAIGSIVGGTPIWAGAGGGLGAVIGYLVVWLRYRGTGLSTGMALALTGDRLELLRLAGFGSKAAGTIRALPLSDIRAVHARSRLLEIRVRVETAGEPLVVDTGKHGVGSGRAFVDELRRRIAA